jgi:hypothetical protein
VQIDHSDELKSLDATLRSVEHFLDLDAMRAELSILREQAGHPTSGTTPTARSS